MASRVHKDGPSRVPRKRKQPGKPSAFSGLRIVFSAAAITVAILFLAFSAIGMLLLARAPQEPIASRLDPAPPVTSQAELAPEPKPAPEAGPALDAKPEPAVKTAETERVVEPAPSRLAEHPFEKEEPVAQTPAPQPEPEPETTATIPNPPAQTEPEAAPAPAQRTVRRHPPKQRHVVRRAQPKQKESRTENPLLQLFGIRQYR